MINFKHDSYDDIDTYVERLVIIKMIIKKLSEIITVNI